MKKGIILVTHLHDSESCMVGRASIDLLLQLNAWHCPGKPAGSVFDLRGNFNKQQAKKKTKLSQNLKSHLSNSECLISEPVLTGRSTNWVKVTLSQAPASGKCPHHLNTFLYTKSRTAAQYYRTVVMQRRYINKTELNVDEKQIKHCKH